ncbi:MAG: M20 metallopeptidase family protein [bacterium]|jgi:amidohydrolase
MGSEILEKALAIKDYVTKIRRHIHQHPEVGFEEVETTALIKRELAHMGVEIAPLPLKTGVLGVLQGTKAGSNAVTALRADIDAIPVLEKTGLPYASQNHGVMHACGHDGHTAVLLGTAKLLSEMRDQFSGTVKFIFQPAEDVLGGAQYMIDAGLFDHQPPVDTIIALHAWPFVEVGKIGVWSGPYNASADKFTVKLFSDGGHGVFHKANDPVLPIAHIVTAFQSIVSREIDALDPVVISVCTLNGGTVFNTIPGEISFSGTVRCHDPKIRMSIEGRMDRIAGGLASAYGREYELIYEYGVPPVINDPQVTKWVAEAGVKALGEGNVVQLDKPVMGSEDFALYLEKIPKATFFRLGITAPGQKKMVQHSDWYDFNDDALPVGIAVFTQYVLDRNQ